MDYTTITSAVDFAGVITGIGAVAVAIVERMHERRHVAVSHAHSHAHVLGPVSLQAPHVGDGAHGC
jgi:hypothetical protein